ncbi:MAG: HD domain-containing protein [Actinomycetota bacterium]|nr:HD domain-containing protein [Actinomycetota bacterium]
MTTREARRAAFRSFEESTAEDWALISSRLPDAQALVPERVLAQLGCLRNDDGGFPVNRLEHSLQTATRAERDGRDDEYVLCALLHDIGDALSPYNHEAIGAAIAKPFVSEANHWMMAHHGFFQGYYFWHHLGGNRNARERFRGSPYFEQTEEFCARYDQVSFDPDYRSEPLEHFEPLVLDILRARS